VKRPWRYVRAAGRLLLLLSSFAGTAASFFFMAGPRADIGRRKRWLQFWTGRALGCLNVRVQAQGTPPRHGVVVSNHLGYLDILVFSTVNAQVFVAKSEVKSWPLVGKFVEWSGGWFIERGRPKDVARVNERAVAVVDNEAVLTLFLEGTSTDGREVLPFHASLLGPVVERGWLVTPAALRFTCEGGDPALCVCWWGDMEFQPHLLRMLLLDSITAHVEFGEAMRGEGDRKELAVRLRERVVDLKAGLDRRIAAAAAA